MPSQRSQLHLCAHWGLTSRISKVKNRIWIDQYGDTPFHVAQNVEVIDELLKIGGQAVIHLTNRVGQTALHRAALLGRKRIIQKLLECGVDPNIKDKWGETATHYLIQAFDRKRQTYYDTLKMLKQQNADFHISNRWQKTPDSMLHQVLKSSKGEVNSLCKSKNWFRHVFKVASN